MIVDGIRYDKSVKVIANEFGYSCEYVRRLARTGKIPHLKVGSRYFFNLEQIMDKWVNRKV